MTPLITLTTDFGAGSGYPAVMKGVILTINPEINIVDISKTIEPQNVIQAAFVLGTAHSFFPRGTIHVAIVDPGVGGSRQGVIVQTPDGYYTAPDNGILTYVLSEYLPNMPQAANYGKMMRVKLPDTIKAVSLTNREYWRNDISSTFHGRDVFAPVAAHLSLGIAPELFGISINSLNLFPIPVPQCDRNGTVTGCVLHIDSFGNIITNIRKTDLPGLSCSIEIRDRIIRGLSHYYAQTNTLCALIGSSDYLEIALPNANAASALYVKIGDEIKIRP